MRHWIAAAILLTLPIAAPAEMTTVCQMDRCMPVTVEPSALDHAQDLTTQLVWQLANDILSISGLAPNFKVLSTEDVDNAAAMIIDEERYLAYNPLWIAKFDVESTTISSKTWALYGVIAHEIGHHLQGHTILAGGSRPATELEADEYAGFVLAGLGASLPDAQTLWQDFSTTGSSTHPPRHQRLQAVERGWSRFNERRTAFLGRNNAPASRDDSAGEPVPVEDGTAGTETETETATVIETPTIQPDTTSATRRTASAEVCQTLPDNGLSGRICASSMRSGFDVARLADGGRREPWIEEEEGNGPGVFLTLEFDAPQDLSRLRIVNGHNGSEQDFRRHARLEAVTLTGSNGHTRSIVVRDKRDWQDWTLVGFKGVTWLQLSVDSVIDGRRYDDLAISALLVE